MKNFFQLRTFLLLFLAIFTTHDISAQISEFKNYEGKWNSEPFGDPYSKESALETFTMINTISGDGKSLVVSRSFPEEDDYSVTITDKGNGKITAVDNMKDFKSGKNSEYIVNVNSTGSGSEIKLKKIESESLIYDILELRYSSADNTVTLLWDVTDVGGEVYNPASVIINPNPGVTIEQRRNGSQRPGNNGEMVDLCSWWQIVKFNRTDAGSTSLAVNTSDLSAEQKEVIDAHNFYRTEVKSDPIIWSDELAAFAQAWADHIAQTDCQLQHRPSDGQWRQKYGENIYMGSSLSLKAAVDAFGSEKSKYNGEALSGDNWYASGHYTQMIWNNTTKVGCGYAKCSNGNYIVVFNYDPPGNYMGETPYKK